MTRSQGGAPVVTLKGDVIRQAVQPTPAALPRCAACAEPLQLEEADGDETPRLVCVTDGCERAGTRSLLDVVRICEHQAFGGISTPALEALVGLETKAQRLLEGAPWLYYTLPEQATEEDLDRALLVMEIRQEAAARQRRS